MNQEDARDQKEQISWEVQDIDRRMQERRGEAEWSTRMIAEITANMALRRTVLDAEGADPRIEDDMDPEMIRLAGDLEYEQTTLNEANDFITNIAVRKTDLDV